MVLRILSVLVCVSAVLPSQHGGGQAEDELARQRAAKAEAAMDEGKADGSKVSEEEWARLTPEQRLARNVTHGASAHCRFQATVKPAKLMPGQSGVVVVSAILLGDAVIPAPAPLEVVSAPQQGWLSLGAMTVLPAVAGKLAKAYLGRPVYDNYAVLEVPITVSPEAELGKKQVVTIDMRFDLYDGNSAQAVGRFLDRVTAEVEFGRVADPTVLGFSDAEVPAAAGNGQQKAANPTTSVQRNDPAQRVVGGAEPMPQAANSAETEPVKPAASGESLPVDQGEMGVPLPLLLGGGALILLILVLILRKK